MSQIYGPALPEGWRQIELLGGTFTFGPGGDGRLEAAWTTSDFAAQDVNPQYPGRVHISRPFVKSDQLSVVLRKDPHNAQWLITYDRDSDHPPDPIVDQLIATYLVLS
jgi:hypothetical protein